jgi:TM2 domain-containing membrane protein YozV
MQTNNNRGSLHRQGGNQYGREKNKEKEHPAKYPIFLSAAVYPGAGQLFQRRILAGIFFGIAFTIMFLTFVFIMGSIIIEFYSLGLNFDNANANDHPPLAPALWAFAATMLIYIVNILDTHIAFQRKLMESKKK